MSDFEPANAFERSVRAAQAGELAPAQVMSELVGATLVVPSGSPVGADFEGFAPLLFDREGTPMLGCFTDLSRIGEFAGLTPYAMTMTGRDLVLRMPPGHGVVVNPGQAVGFEIPPNGIDELRAELAAQ